MNELDPSLKILYEFYHRRWWCYRQLFFRFKCKHTLLNALALITVCIGMVIGRLFECGIATTCLTAFGAFIKSWTDFKNFATKVDMCRFAYTTYDKILTFIHLESLCKSSTEEWEKTLIKSQTLDDTIVELTPIVTDDIFQTYEKNYKSKETKV